ncbi:NlpC/P60 family protein [Fulvimarina sp. 2208YS6-2-32]|uniref:NlpC/P60 family protein n=1 Tax=Fulvimarina uroteuthidis TaxID=3098149 RepID=A0ABU5I2S2_9HYPH|nr:NlpC/P60 family protein [Fulvimarina sp. 2208YS6-2-32]MDY8109119.1 NlpC/P60 family protein [Fulvimarina sp. 2208YS6-2-32]
MSRKGGEIVAGERVAALAKGWLGTPYRHQAARKGVGCDCLGLVRGVWRDLYGAEPERPLAYTMSWAVENQGERLLDAARRHLVEAPATGLGEGAVVLFRWRARLPASHCGILDGRGRLIHAYEGMACPNRVVRGES